MEKKIKICVILLIISIVLASGWFILDTKRKQTLPQKVQTKEIQIKGVVEMQKTSWSPSFDRECIFPSPIIKDSDKIYYLDNICPFNPFELLGKEIIINGVMEEREINIPLNIKEPNSLTRKETVIVINIKNVEIEQRTFKEQKLKEPDNYLSYQSLLEKNADEWMEIGVEGTFNQAIEYMTENCEKDPDDSDCQGLEEFKKINVKGLKKEEIFEVSSGHSDTGKFLMFAVKISDKEKVIDRQMPVIIFRDGNDFNQCEIIKNSTDKAPIFIAGVSTGDLYKKIGGIRIYHIYEPEDGHFYYWCSKNYNTFIFTRTPEIVDKYTEVFYEQ